jgi:hypothetical protein
MTTLFRINGNIATLEVTVDGYKVTVHVEPKSGPNITADDAAVILSSAAGEFPSLARFPEPLRR